jgi:dTDP-4-dehydrorhamnose reductase
MIVTGSTGMLGAAWMRAANVRGLSAVGVARSNADFSIDLCDDMATACVLDEVEPSVVINCAAMTDVQACERDVGKAYATNARAVRTLAQHCQMRGIYLVQVSTDHFFTGDGAAKHDESVPVRLVNEYARAKFAAEGFALTCPGSLVLRTNVVGFRGWARPTFVEWAMRALDGGETIPLFDDVFTSSIDVGSFVSAALDLIARRASGLLNLASSEVSSKRAFIETLARAFGLSLAATTGGSVASMAGARRAESCGLDVLKAERLLGYRLPGLSEVVDALKAEHATRPRSATRTIHAMQAME